MDRTILVSPSIPTREFLIKKRSLMSVVQEAFVVYIYMLSTTSTGTLPEEAIRMMAPPNITAAHGRILVKTSLASLQSQSKYRDLTVGHIVH